MDVKVGQVVMRIVLDACSVLIAFVPWIVIQTAVKPSQRGFYCNDESIKYPYHSSTIPNSVLISFGNILPIIVILVVEVARQLIHKKQTRPNPPLRVGDKGAKIPHSLVIWYKTVIVFVYGTVVQITLTNIGKYTVGRLRPNFLDVCKPDWDQTQCLDPQGMYRYVTNVKCTQDEDIVNDSRVSFPSGHASTASYSMLFLVLYLQARWTWRGSRLVLHACQAMLLYGAFYTCVSRIMDNKHHPGDVLFGAFLGSVTAVLVALYLSPVFRRPGVEDVLDALETGVNREDVHDPQTHFSDMDNSRSRRPDPDKEGRSVPLNNSDLPASHRHYRTSTRPGNTSVVQVGHPRL